MMNKVPVIASNLPGVRQPVLMTGNGLVVPIGDSAALSDAVITILDNLEAYKEKINVGALKEEFSPINTGRNYERLYKEVLSAPSP